MRIGIDASCWANRRGYGRYTREIITALVEEDSENTYTLFLDAQTERLSEGLPDRAPRVVVPTSAAAADAASADGHRSLADLWAMARAVSRHRRQLDLFYFPTVYTFFPVPRRLRPLITIHDTTAERHPELIFPHWRNRFFWNVKVGWALRQAALILTVSGTAKAAIMGQFHLADEQVRVVSDAVTGDFARPADRAATERILAAHGIAPGDRFILYVGGISPHKNIETLLDAFCSLTAADAFRDLKLVLVGDAQGDVFFSSFPSLQERINSRGVAAQVVFTGFVPDADLAHWYSAAQALVMPSVDEGFGLPALESMACGTPVVVSRAGALPEVVGNAGLLFDPRSTAGLEAALTRVLTDTPLHDTLAARGLQRAQQFTWRASARSAIDAFRDVHGQRR